MQNDQRLTPLPVVTNDLQTSPIEFSAAYPSSYEDSLDGKRSIKQYVNVVYKRLPIILAITPSPSTISTITEVKARISKANLIAKSIYSPVPPHRMGGT